MKFLLSSIFCMALALCNATAALITQTDIENVDTDTGVNFTFNKFNPALGTLTGIDLVINYSTPSGSAFVTNNSPTNNVTVRYIKSNLDIFDDAGLGFGGFFGSDINLNSNPQALQPNNFVLAPSSSQTFTINGSQSLIGGTAQTESISSGSFGSYLGAGTVSFYAVSSINLTTIGSSFTVDSTLYNAATSVSLLYNYTPSAAVPEPSQVAASIFALGSVAFYFFIRRRRILKSLS